MPADYPPTEPQEVCFRREKTDAGFYLLCDTRFGEVRVAEVDIPELRDAA